MIGCPCASRIRPGADGSLIGANASSLKMGQFWKISMSAAPLWSAAAVSTDCRCLRSESTERATKEASAPSASDTGLNG